MRLSSQREPQRDDDPRAESAERPCFTRTEARLVFAEMVRGEMRNGPLTSWRRRRLIQYAAILNLTPLDAGRIVTDVWYEWQARMVEMLESADGSETPDLHLVSGPGPAAAVPVAAPLRWPLSLQLGLTLILGFIISRVWIYFS